jgi:hypothetical protein
MPGDTLSQYCGRVFEVGFNCGLLTFLAQQEQAKALTTQGACSLYQPDLAQLRFHPMATFAITQAKTIGTSPQLRQVAEQILLHFCFKGYLLGLHFLEEYLSALGRSYASRQVHVRYVQCSFREENSLGMIKVNPVADEQALRRCLAQLDPELGSGSLDVKKHSQTGRFLKADCLVLLQWGGAEKQAWGKGPIEEAKGPSSHAQKGAKEETPPKRGGFLLTKVMPESHGQSHAKVSEDPARRHWRILCLDFSVHSLTTGRLRDPNHISTLRQQLLSELGYLRTRGVFSNLGYDVAEGLPEMLFARGLEEYLTAFKKKDKESAKLIQAGGYAYDFYELLCRKGLIRDEDEVICHAFGVSDRDMTSMHVRREHMTILETCQKIYQNNPSEETIDHARDWVVETIQNTARWSFEGEPVLFNSLRTMDRTTDGCFWLPPLTETVPVLSTQDRLPVDRLDPSLIMQLGGPTFASTLTVQQAHSLLVRDALIASAPYLFLTGNPGIGKTTAIVEYLLDCERRGEGFLFFYLSPRTQVNLDLIQKFRVYPGGPLQGSVLTLTTNADLLEGCQEPTVLYSSAQLQGQGMITRQGVQATVTFLEAGSTLATTRQQRSSGIDPLLEDQIWDRGVRTPGVLYSICQALAANMQQPLSNAIVATVSIQSLKKKGSASDTLDHLEKIFACAYDRTRGRVLPERMQALAQRMRHLVFMVDEITGDESGVAFLAGLHSFAQRYGLFAPTSPFHTKIIIADASVVNRRVIERHLESSAYEPEKIYFQHIADPSQLAPMTVETFDFKQLPATAINTNAYPASALELSYHLCIECQRYDEHMTQLPQSELFQALQCRLVEDLLRLIRRPKTEVPQIIVYIQDKQRLADLIERLQTQLGRFEKEKDYLEIHASISEKARRTAEQKRTLVRVVFMTASASRGLSFPDATHFLIDVPRFAIEANTMEILQVMYRGRGGSHDRETKYVHFYLSDRVLYQEETDRLRAFRERLLGIVDMLLILKTSMMTRIAGAGKVRRQYFQMIPVGGKAVSSAGATFPDTMAELIRQLTNEARSHPKQPDLGRAAKYLQQLFGEGNFRWERQAENTSTKRTYVPERSILLQRFRDLTSQGFDQLFQWPTYEPVYHSGGFLVIPNQHKKLDQRYLLDLRDHARLQRGKQALAILRHLEEDEELPEQVRLLIGKAKVLLWQLQQADDEKTQQFVQSSRYLDQYAALPLLAFLVPEVFEEYFATEHDDQDPVPFRAILASLLRAWYPAETMLPIGADYRTYPFLIFRSFNLEEIRHRLFAGNSVFASYEMNILNMILSTQSAD